MQECARAVSVKPGRIVDMSTEVLQVIKSKLTLRKTQAIVVRSQKVEGRVVPVHAMKTWNGTGGKDPFLLNLRNRWSGWSAAPTGRFIPRETARVPS